MVQSTPLESVTLALQPPADFAHCASVKPLSDISMPEPCPAVALKSLPVVNAIAANGSPFDSP